jgi:hypothetical protein
VDKSPEFVGNFEGLERPFGSRSTAPLQLAPRDRLTAPTTLGARSPLRGAPERVAVAPKGLTERELLRGYGLDPDDLEREYLDR